MKSSSREISRDFEDVMFNGGNTCGATEKLFNAHLRSDTLLQRPDLKERDLWFLTGRLFW